MNALEVASKAKQEREKVDRERIEKEAKEKAWQKAKHDGLVAMARKAAASFNGVNGISYIETERLTTCAQLFKNGKTIAEIEVKWTEREPYSDGYDRDSHLAAFYKVMDVPAISYGWSDEEDKFNEYLGKAMSVHI